MKIFNLTIIKTKDYEEKINQLNEEYNNLDSQLSSKYEKDFRQFKIQLQYEEKAKLFTIRKLVKNNKKILTELEKWLKNPNMFDTGEDYKNYVEAYLKLKQETIDFTK